MTTLQKRIEFVIVLEVIRSQRGEKKEKPHTEGSHALRLAFAREAFCFVNLELPGILE
jgi:hypothetical protein